jgi:hypothetical protein
MAEGSSANYINLHRVTEAFEKAFAIFSRKTKRFDVGETEFCDCIANAFKVLFIEPAFGHGVFCPIDELSKR